MKIKEKIGRSKDRRRDIEIQKVPLEDNTGVKIMNNRRNKPDRRISNIEVEWIDEEIEISEIFGSA